MWMLLKQYGQEDTYPKNHTTKKKAVASQGFATSVKPQTQPKAKETKLDPVSKLCGAKHHTFATCPKYKIYNERKEKC